MIVFNSHIKEFDDDMKYIFDTKENNHQCNQKDKNTDVSDHSDEINGDYQTNDKIKTNHHIHENKEPTTEYPIKYNLKVISDGHKNIFGLYTDTIIWVLYNNAILDITKGSSVFVFDER